MTSFQKMYQTKKKRVRDPNLPPPPNLLSHDKTIRGITADLGVTQNLTQRQQDEIAMLKRKLQHSDYRLELLTNLVRELRDKNK